MASLYVKRGKFWARIKGLKQPGKWSDVPTGYREDQRAEAERFAREAQRQVDKRNGIERPNVKTLREWIAAWLPRREEAGHDWKKDRGKLDKHILPRIGDMPLDEIGPPVLVSLFHDLRFKSDPSLAPRTLHNIYSVVAAVFRDARLAGVLTGDTPCILTDDQLGPIIDGDEAWRMGALFTRDEAKTLISDPRIPFDRRVVYGFGLLAGLRPGEAAALRWRDYNITAEPLRSLLVALSYATDKSKVKRTKTNTTKHVPVHPTLAAMLDAWRATGWAAMMGHEPTQNDLILPLPPEVKRTKRTGERFRGTDYSGKRWREVDLPMLGWRERTVYDTKATFITLVLEDGADPTIIRDRVTHTKIRRDAFTGYDRGPHWQEACEAVSKLQLAATCYQADAISNNVASLDALRRRVSNHRPGSSPPTGVESGREVILSACDHGLALLAASCSQLRRRR